MVKRRGESPQRASLAPGRSLQPRLWQIAIPGSLPWRRAVQALCDAFYLRLRQLRRPIDTMPTQSLIRVKKFDPSTLKPGRIIFIIGKRHTGKSVLMKDLLYHLPCPDYILAMAPTEDTLQMFREFVPHACVFDHFDQERLNRLVTLQKELTSMGKRRSALIILDDCLYQKGSSSLTPCVQYSSTAATIPSGL